MLKFDKSYFADEVREGFYVPGFMKRCWASQLMLLSEIDRICKKHNIGWCIFYGTLLGAVRHKGFIPWDDDIDIAMLYEDYLRFAAVAERELPEELGFYSYEYNGKKDFQFIAGVGHREHPVISGHGEKYHGFPLSTCIDIFALNTLSESEQEEARRQEELGLCRAFRAMSESDRMQDESFRSSFLMLSEKRLGKRLSAEKSLPEQLSEYMLQRLSLYESSSSGLCTEFSQAVSQNKRYKYKKEWFRNPQMLEFEGMLLPAPDEYDRVLREYYGDYSQISRGTSEHSYPSYRREGFNPESFFKSSHDFLYSFSPKDFCRAKENERDTASVADIELLFVIGRGVSFRAIEPLYRRAVKEGIDAAIMPVPYYYRGFDGSPEEWHYDADELPEDVRLMDFGEGIPYCRVIVTDTAIDDCSYTMSVEPAFYSSLLKYHTDCLVYLPCFVTDEISFDRAEDAPAAINMEYYVTVPGLAHSDYTILQSDSMRECYLRVLRDFAGEEYIAEWEKRLVGIGSPCFDGTAREEQEGSGAVFSFLRGLL